MGSKERTISFSVEFLAISIVANIFSIKEA
jgi:hypothetical protein